MKDSTITTNDITIDSNILEGNTSYIMSLSSDIITSIKYRIHNNEFKENIEFDNIISGILLIESVSQLSTITDIEANNNTNKQSSIVKLIDT